MKKLIFMLCLMGVSAISIKTYGSQGPSDCKKVIEGFIDGQMNTDFKQMNMVMAPNAVLRIQRGDAVIVQNKSEVVDEMRSIGIAHQICNPSYEMIGESEAIVVARVDFDYGYTTQHNYLIIEKNENREWKIMEILKMFSDKITNNLNPLVSSKK